ncbi:putative RiPP precursor [Candidatus Frankia alpina]|uniref:putative RiPP precursor n=1 Tax=Candidatus Frankia alpina TaxID=2699483 RepID=UPI0013D8C144|nr:putative RiPP precursor [Candidatus Frankia alpina]
MKTTYEAPELQSQGTFRQATGFVAFGGGWGGGGWSRWGGWGGGGWSRWGGWGGSWGGGWGGGGWGW